MNPLLQKSQRELQNALLTYAERGFFLRRSRDENTLWVSDLPRHMPPGALEKTILALREQGFFCECSSPDALLSIDLSPERYQQLLAPLPNTLPPMPSHDDWHPAYALCRLLFLHRAPPPSLEPFAHLRLVLKAASSCGDTELLHLVPRLHGLCAQRIRQGQPLSGGAGQILAYRIARES